MRGFVLLVGACLAGNVIGAPYDGSADFKCADPRPQADCNAPKGVESWPDVSNAGNSQAVSFVDICICPQIGEVIHLDATLGPIGDDATNLFFLGLGAAGSGARNFETIFYRDDGNTCLGSQADWSGDDICTIDKSSCEAFETGDKSGTFTGCIFDQTNSNYVVPGTNQDCQGKVLAFDETTSSSINVVAGVRLRTGITNTTGVDCNVRVALFAGSRIEGIEPTNFPSFESKLTQNCPECPIDVNSEFQRTCGSLLAQCRKNVVCNGEFEQVQNTDIDPETYEPQTDSFAVLLNCFRCIQKETRPLSLCNNTDIPTSEFDFYSLIFNQTCGGKLETCLESQVCAAQAQGFLSTAKPPANPTPEFVPLSLCAQCVFELGKTYKPPGALPATLINCNKTESGAALGQTPFGTVAMITLSWIIGTLIMRNEQ